MIRSFLSHPSPVLSPVPWRIDKPLLVGSNSLLPFCFSLSSPPCSCWYGEIDDSRTVQRTDRPGNSSVGRTTKQGGL